MKNLLFLLLFLAVLSCTNSSTSDSTAAQTITDSVATDSAVVSSLSTSDASSADANSAPADYLTALGNEPGWILKMQKTPGGSFPAVLVYSYGTDTLTGELAARMTLLDGKAIAANQEAFAANLQLRGKAVPVEVLVTKEKCVDDAGMERPVQVKLTVGESWHPGCGSFARN